DLFRVAEELERCAGSMPHTDYPEKEAVLRAYHKRGFLRRDDTRERNIFLTKLYLHLFEGDKGGKKFDTKKVAMISRLVNEIERETGLDGGTRLIHYMYRAGAKKDEDPSLDGTAYLHSIPAVAKREREDVARATQASLEALPVIEGKPGKIHHNLADWEDGGWRSSQNFLSEPIDNICRSHYDY